jgi:Ca-activated chloride channel homolog
MIFRNPQYLAFIIILIPFIIATIFRGRSHWNACSTSRSVLYSDITDLQRTNPTWKTHCTKLLPWLTIVALLLAIVALARPQLGIKQSLMHREGIDIIIALDVSSSMLAEDFKIKGKQTNRLEVVKAVAKDFITKRPDDRIGIVIFAGHPYILSPLTWDHDWCLARLSELQAGIVEEGTAIGSGLATAINRLHESKAKSKVIILLTDGDNNAGQVTPEAAAKAAKALSIVVYTIGAGSKGPVPMPVIDETGHRSYQNVQIDIDENLLTQIAEKTGGRYFQAP